MASPLDTRSGRAEQRRGTPASWPRGVWGPLNSEGAEVMPVASLSEYLRTRRAQIDEGLVRFLPAPPQCPPVLYAAMRYSLEAGGKRLRPVLTLAAAEAIAARSPSAEQAIAVALPAACAIELIHTYSLIHDDLPGMDNDSLRRGHPTNHVVHGEGMAILAGDGLLTEAFALMAAEPRDPSLATRKLRTIQVVGEAAGASGMVGGQAVDLAAVGSATTFTGPSLQDMHARKTGALIRAAAVAGAIMAGGDDPSIRAVEEFGRHLGLAFQIVDDILDVEGEAISLGKTAGKDAQAGKPTYPAVYGLSASHQLAAGCHQSALSALKTVGLQESRLADIAAWVIERTS